MSVLRQVETAEVFMVSYENAGVLQSAEGRCCWFGSRLLVIIARSYACGLIVAASCAHMSTV